MWPEIELSGGLELPVHITPAGDGTGRLFMIEQRGRIRIIKDGKLAATPFLDTTDRVSCCGERGLLSIVFPPGYVEKNYFYVNYTSSDQLNQVFKIGRHYESRDIESRRTPTSLTQTAKKLLLIIEQPAVIHNGGRMAFGPGDGYLYIGTGDGGPANDPGQPGHKILRRLLGKILRIDVESGASPYEYPDHEPLQSDERTSRARYGLLACAIHGALASTGRLAIFTLRMLDKPSTKRSTSNLPRQPAARITDGKSWKDYIVSGLKSCDPTGSDVTRGGISSLFRMRRR